MRSSFGEILSSSREHPFPTAQESWFVEEQGLVLGRGKEARERSVNNWKWQICEGFLWIAERYFVHKLCQPLGDSKPR